MSKTKEQKQTPKSGKGLRIQGIVLGVILAICAVQFLPTTLIVVVGMVPTAVAYFVDTSRQHVLGSVVLCLNFAGVIPALLSLWHQGSTMANAMSIITQPFMLAMMLFPAACGWLLYIYVPYMMTGLMRRKAELRIKTLEKYQQDLVDQWGGLVTGVVSKSELAKEPAHSDLSA